MNICLRWMDGLTDDVAVEFALVRSIELCSAGVVVWL